MAITKILSAEGMVEYYYSAYLTTLQLVFLVGGSLDFLIPII